MKKVPQNGTVASHERYLYRGYLQIAAQDTLDNRNVLRTLLWDPLEPVATRPWPSRRALPCTATAWTSTRMCRRSSIERELLRRLKITPPMEQPPAPEDSSSPSSGPARCTTKNSPWPITITAITTPKTAGGSTATPSLKKGDGICTVCVGMLLLYMLII